MDRRKKRVQRCTRWTGAWLQEVRERQWSQGHACNFSQPINYKRTTVMERTLEANYSGTTPRFPYLGSRIWYSMGNISDKASNVSILYQSSHPFRNVIQKPHGVAKEVHWPQDPSCLTKEFLSNGAGREEKTSLFLYLQVECPEQKDYKSVLSSIPTTNCPLFLNCELLPFLSSTLNLSQYTYPRGYPQYSHVYSSKPFRRKKLWNRKRLYKYLLVQTSHSPFHHSINMELTSSRKNFNRKVREGYGAPRSLWSRWYA